MTDATTDDDLEVEVPEEGDFDIEIADDTPEADQGRPPRAASEEGKPPVGDESDDDLSQHSESVQKRIKRLKYEFHEERRSKEAADREREAAVSYAQNLINENKQLRKNLTEGEGVLVNQSKARVTAEMAAAKRAYKEAYEAGDSDAVVDAQEKMNRLQMEQSRIDTWRPPVVEQQPAARAQPAPQQQFVPPKPDAKAAAWAEKNTWFDNKNPMSRYAMLVHQELVEDGVDLQSDTYYDTIDKEMRKRYPDRFDEPELEVKPTRQVNPVVAPGGRTPPASRTKVVLKQSEIAIAKRLGLTPQQYAAQVMKDRQNG
tara:strand:- start:338 stop:1282 length:945 start_codon:yes stop_codon:yes gene_type:complete